uniref:Uncharacterized protein n=1 Tax=Rhizophora mucronata TaxID=61149 RepID=A0A2P2PPF8_RHIMU
MPKKNIVLVLYILSAMVSLKIVPWKDFKIKYMGAKLTIDSDQSLMKSTTSFPLFSSKKRTDSWHLLHSTMNWRRRHAKIPTQKMASNL